MVIYQVLDEKNYAVGEYQNYDSALRFSQDIEAWFIEHSYRIEVLLVEVADEQG